VHRREDRADEVERLAETLGLRACDAGIDLWLIRGKLDVFIGLLSYDCCRGNYKVTAHLLESSCLGTLAEMLVLLAGANNHLEKSNKKQRFAHGGRHFLGDNSQCVSI
jgi:hypothetical protein